MYEHEYIRKLAKLTLCSKSTPCQIPLMREIVFEALLEGYKTRETRSAILGFLSIHLDPAAEMTVTDDCIDILVLAFVDMYLTRFDDCLQRIAAIEKRVNIPADFIIAERYANDQL